MKLTSVGQEEDLACSDLRKSAANMFLPVRRMMRRTDRNVFLTYSGRGRRGRGSACVVPEVS